MATITLTDIKTNKHTSEGTLTITNLSTSMTYSYWSINVEVPEGTVITSLRHFKVEDNGTKLTPERIHDQHLYPGQIMTEKLEWEGEIAPSVFTLQSPPAVLPGEVIKLNFLGMRDIREVNLACHYQYSYPESKDFSQVNLPNPKYFKIIDWPNPYYPSANGGIQVSLYPDDHPFKKGSNTDARSEMRFLQGIFDDKEYICEWTSTLTDYTSPDQFCLFQIFGSDEPNVMIRYRNGSYQLLCSMGNNPNINFPGSPLEDLNKEINWKVDFRLSEEKGYIRVFKNEVQVVEILGNTSGGGSSYIKLGNYRQHEKGTGIITTIYKSFKLSVK